MTITKEQIRAYQKRYRAKTLNIGIPKTLAEQLRGIRSYTTFKSDNETLKYLLELERNCREKKILNVSKACEKCGVPTDVILGSYVGITHKHIDPMSNCTGNIITKIEMHPDTKTKIEMLPGITETKTDVKELPGITETKTDVKELPKKDLRKLSGIQALFEEMSLKTE